jgi:hypothetical protein
MGVSTDPATRPIPPWGEVLGAMETETRRVPADVETALEKDRWDWPLAVVLLGSVLGLYGLAAWAVVWVLGIIF